MGTDTWFDVGGENFSVALTHERKVGDIELPQDLCGAWAYVKWEHAGCPRRSDAEAQAEYGAGVTEMKQMLARGESLDFLWKVAHGEIGYDEALARPGPVRPAPGSANGASSKWDIGVVPKIPEAMVNENAFVMWVEAGKPDMGDSDMSEASRAKLTEEILNGGDVSEIAARVRAAHDQVREREREKKKERKREKGGLLLF